MKINLKYLNFTKNEMKVILFMLIVLVSGFSIKYIKYISANSSFAAFDYTENESMFKKLSQSSLYSTAKDTLAQKDSSINNIEGSLPLKLKATEDSLKNTGKKKSKKEEKLKPKSININTAAKEILIMLPGVGESTAEKIINYRETHNGFKKIENIMKVKGIGKKKFEKLKDYITVE
jgi:competence protein ComEA